MNSITYYPRWLFFLVLLVSRLVVCSRLFVVYRQRQRYQQQEEEMKDIRVAACTGMGLPDTTCGFGGQAAAIDSYVCTMQYSGVMPYRLLQYQLSTGRSTVGTVQRCPIRVPHKDRDAFFLVSCSHDRLRVHHTLHYVPMTYGSYVNSHTPTRNIYSLLLSRATTSRVVDFSFGLTKCSSDVSHSLNPGEL